MKRVSISALFGVSSWLLLVVADVAPMQIAEPEHVSLIQLIAVPEKFDGKIVRVSGFCRLQYYSEGLYFHREDLERAMYKNAVQLVFESELENREDFDDIYVIVEGRFFAPADGDIYAGELREIDRFERHPSRRELSPPSSRRPQ